MMDWQGQQDDAVPDDLLAEVLAGERQKVPSQMPVQAIASRHK